MKTKSAFRIILFLSLLFGYGTRLAFAQESRFSVNKFVSAKGDTLNYRLLNPDYNPARKYPLVIFLHGSGERGHDNIAQLKWGVMNFATDQMMALHPCYVVAPQCPEKQNWSASMDQLKQLIDKLIKEQPIDATRIYITGLSMGGFGTFEALTRYPELFAAAVPVCGGGDTSKAASFVSVPIWIFTGAEDPAVKPELSMNMAQALTKAGGHPGFTQYPEVGHFSWLAAYSDPLMIEWLFRQHK